MTTLRHQLQDDERVLLTVVSDRPQSFRVEKDEALKLAWAVIRDLDPEGAPARVTRGRPRKRGVMIGSVLLRALSERYHHTAELAELVKQPRNIVSIRLCQYRDQGFVEVISPGKANRPAIWALTDAGRNHLHEYVRRVELQQIREGA